MTTIKVLISRDRLQYLIFFSLSLAVMGLTGMIYLTDNQPFERFIGKVNPLLAGIFIIILGSILLARL